MDVRASELWKKVVKFFFTSGIGFILDFCAYILLTQALSLGVREANFFSSLIGATFVFIVSTHRIFDAKDSRLPVPAKYCAYIVYQLVLISLVSLLGGRLDLLIHENFRWEPLLRYSKLVCKVLITPVTMTCNFLTMRFIAEKI